MSEDDQSYSDEASTDEEDQSSEDDYSECEAFDDFRELIDDLRSKYTCLNPKDGKLFKHVSAKRAIGSSLDLDETGQEFIRGGIVAIMSAWESYIHDLFQEAFNILVRVGSGEQQNLGTLHRSWPACRTIIQDEIKRKAEKKGDRVEVVAYDLLCEAEKLPEDGDNEKIWVKLLRTHCQNVLEQKTLLPIFSCQLQSVGRDCVITIDELFRQLFKIDKKSKRLSQTLIEVGGFKYAIIIPDGQRVNVNLEPTDTSDQSAIEALYNISRLYYGPRCTLVHGKHKRTLQHGALKDFPNNPDNFPMPRQSTNLKISEYYVNLYTMVEERGRAARVSYRTFLNLNRFYNSAAYFLMLAVARWFYINVKYDTGKEVLIWGYDPDLPPEIPQPTPTQSQS